MQEISGWMSNQIWLWCIHSLCGNTTELPGIYVCRGDLSKFESHRTGWIYNVKWKLESYFLGLDLHETHVEACVRKGKMYTRNVTLWYFNTTSAYFCISHYSSHVRSSQQFMTLPADSSKTLIPIGMMRSYTRNLGASLMQSISTSSTMSSYPR